MGTRSATQKGWERAGGGLTKRVVILVSGLLLPPCHDPTCLQINHQLQRPQRNDLTDAQPFAYYNGHVSFDMGKGEGGGV